MTSFKKTHGGGREGVKHHSEMSRSIPTITPPQHREFKSNRGGDEIQIKSDRNKKREDMKRIKNMVTQQQQHTYVRDGI